MYSVLFLCSVLKQESRVTSLKRKQINNQPKSKFVKGLILSHGVFSYIYTLYHHDFGPYGAIYCYYWTSDWCNTRAWCAESRCTWYGCLNYVVHVVTPTCCSNLFVRSRHPGSGLGDRDLGRDAQICLLPATTSYSKAFPGKPSDTMSIACLFRVSSQTLPKHLSVLFRYPIFLSWLLLVWRSYVYTLYPSNDREPRPSPVHCSVSLNCESCKACREESHTSNMGFEKKHPQLATLHFL